jgi:hypothetical protein
MKLIYGLILTVVFSSNIAAHQTAEAFTLAYTIDNIQDESHLNNLVSDLQKLYKDCVVKHRYKPDSKKGQIILYYKEDATTGENQKQKIDPALIKQKIIHYGMTPVDFTLEKTK